MSLVNSVAWVVGGKGVIGRNLCRGLLEAGATVIISSRNEERLQRLSDDLNHPSNLVAIKGSLLDGKAEELVREAMGMVGQELNHVVAHGGVRWWSPKFANENHRSIFHREAILDLKQEDFFRQSIQVAAAHHTIAQHLVPRLRASVSLPTYTFVTGNQPHVVGGSVQPMAYLNAASLSSFAQALKMELAKESPRPIPVSVLKVGLPLGRPIDMQLESPRHRPLSHDLGLICAGMATARSEGIEVQINEQGDVEALLKRFPITCHISNLPILRYSDGRVGTAENYFAVESSSDTGQPRLPH